MKYIKSNNTLGILLGFFCLVLIISLVFGIFTSKNNSIHKTPSSAPTKKNITVKIVPKNHNLTITDLYPRESLSCQTSLSLVSLSSDYIITNMDCGPTSNPSSSVVLSCDGTIFNSVVSQNCYSPLSSSSVSSRLSCNGALGQLTGPNMSLNYNCNLPNIATTNIYACNGIIFNYTSYAINVPMSVGCNSTSLG